MFAYCNNNPLINCDPEGEDPVLIAAAGGAIAGGLISLFFYLKNTDDAAFGAALLSIIGGALAGALGGAASMLTGNPQFVCVLGASVIAGLVSDAAGGSFMISSLIALLGTYFGLQIDISMYFGLELMFASFIASLGVGFPAEMAAQSMHNDLNSNRVENNMQVEIHKGSGNGHFQGGSVYQPHIFLSLD